MIDYICDQAVENITQAIVMQAAGDYLTALVEAELYGDIQRGIAELKRNSKKEHTDEEYEEIRVNKLQRAYSMKTDCEQFFRGKWYKAMCSLDGEWMLQILRKKYAQDKAAAEADGTDIRRRWKNKVL